MIRWQDSGTPARVGRPRIYADDREKWRLWKRQIRREMSTKFEKSEV